MNSGTPRDKADGAPLVSVCIPTFNRAPKLHRYVKKLLECDYRNIEVLISDNGSTDETVNVCESLRMSDSRIAIYRHDRNMGPIANFEFIRRHASGRYFLWHADDDYLDAHYISACVDLLESDRSLVLAYGTAAYHVGDNIILEYGRRVDPQSKYSSFRVFAYLWRVTDNSIFCGLYRTSAVEHCILPNIFAGDWAWVAEVLSMGNVRRIPGILVYRERGSSASSSPDGLTKLIKSLNQPDWQARFPVFAIAAGIGSFVLENPRCFSKHTRYQLIPLAAAVFVLLLIKGNLARLMRLAKRVPGAKFLYRKIS